MSLYPIKIRSASETFLLKLGELRTKNYLGYNVICISNIIRIYFLIGIKIIKKRRYIIEHLSLENSLFSPIMFCLNTSTIIELIQFFNITFGT